VFRLALLVVIAASLTISASCGASPSTSESRPGASTSPGAVVFPPITVNQARSLAAVEGKGSDVQEFRSESEGRVDCPQPKRYVLVQTGQTGRQVSADLLKYFYDQQLDNRCGSVVLGYTDPVEYGHAYTVGRVILEVNGSSHRLEVDAIPDQIRFVITY
jgi:hypothetical protein